MNAVVTGGSGFIGSAFLRTWAGLGHRAVNLDAMTYAADPRRHEGIEGLTTRHLDVCDEAIRGLIRDVAPDLVIHFAAHTHVTRSETEPEAFYRANVDGTKQVIEACSATGVPLIHVSTDEVYGPSLGHPFREDEKPKGIGRATSAYARSKALAEDLVTAFEGDLEAIVVRLTNCFGPYQHPEKAIARWSIRALRGEPVPVWGDGRYRRQWLYVDDACAAIRSLIEKGRWGEVYNIGPDGDRPSNLEVARSIAALAGRTEDAVYLTDYDRPQHDEIYEVDNSKLSDLGWEPHWSFDAALAETVEWYRGNESWFEPLLPEAERIYDDELPRRQDLEAR